jgi:hypothetical protein
VLSLDARTVVCRKGGHVFTRLDDELLALDPQSGCCYSLSGSATRVWELIESPTEIEAVWKRLLEEYAVDDATCLADLLELVGDLDAAKLVELDRASA